MLRRREKSVHSFFQHGIFRKRAEFAHHRAGDRKTARDVFHLRKGRLLRSADVNEKCDKNQKRIPNQSDESENERKTLANRGSYLCGARITHPGCEKRAQDPATIHGKCREQIESNQQDVNDQQLGNEADPLNVLIVEDSEEDTDLLLFELKRGGFEPVYQRVDTASSMTAASTRPPR